LRQAAFFLQPSSIGTFAFPANAARKLTPMGQLGGERFAGGLKEVRIRMKSVKAIQKITKSMKMIASSRLRAAQNRLDAARPFASTSVKMLKPAENPLADKKKNFVVVIASDRGMCGPINSSAVKVAKKLVEASRAQGVSFKFGLIGEKSVSQLQKDRDVAENVLWVSSQYGKKPVNFFIASEFAERILREESDNITVIYNHFNSIISSSTHQRQLLSYKGAIKARKPLINYEFEEDSQQFHLRDLAEFQLASSLYGAMLDNITSELGGRMSSMDSATKNAGEVIKRLTIRYNSKRQASITTELCEIISGASALVGESNANIMESHSKLVTRG